MQDMLLMHERELKVKYKEMNQQIERIHGLQMNAKYVGLSGTKNIVFGLWLITYGFLVPKTHVQAG
jgi:predicted nucleic acid-binding protein